MAEKKESEIRDEKGVRKQSYKRFKEGRDYTAIDEGQTKALCDLMRKGIFGEEETPDGHKIRNKGGRPRKIESVEELKEEIEKYIDYIEMNASKGVQLIPDTEGLASFLGVHRSTLFEWQKTRPGEYADTIKSALNAIAAYKKQLALNGKIPPIVFATDFNNNHGYVQQQTLAIQATKQLDTLPTRAEIVKKLPNSEEIEDIDVEILEN